MSQEQTETKNGGWNNLYQKYRPFQLRAVVGQQNVVKSLSKPPNVKALTMPICSLGHTGLEKHHLHAFLPP